MKLFVFMVSIFLSASVYAIDPSEECDDPTPTVSDYMMHSAEEGDQAKTDDNDDWTNDCAICENNDGTCGCKS